MRALLLAILAGAPLLAADGTVFNGTKNKPQAGATVSLFRVSQNGPEMLASVKSAVDGTFQLAAPAGSESPGPKLLQAVYAGVTYNRMIPPGTPDSDLQVEVYESSARPGAARVATHMMLLEPQNGSLNISESFVYTNDSKITYNDPDRGTLRFYLPAGAGGKVDVNVVSPNSVPVRRAADKTDLPDVYKLDFPVKPGESRIDLVYQVPFQTPATFETKVLYKDPNTKLLAPVGVTLSAPGLKNLGQEPQSQATIYSIDGPEIKVEVQGAGALSRGGGDTDSGDSGSQIAELLPQLYGKASPLGGFAAAAGGVKWLLAILLATLALVFIYLYRKPVAK
jgi:hypothetical protein